MSGKQIPYDDGSWSRDMEDDMCDNCVTPWKCNGPHVSYDDESFLRHLESLGRGLGQVGEARPRDDLIAPDLSEFLLARVAEDEEIWRAWDGPLPIPHERVLDECNAKRILLARLGVPDPHGTDEDCLDCDLLYILALPYADHPDHREEWKP